MRDHVRVRFAPSPTGPLHIGGVRTALYNYLFAKKTGGKFILRIEDTDQSRYVEGAERYIIDALAWCGMTLDEGPNEGGAYGPYRQSERKHLYRNYAEQLIESGNAYYAFDSAEELDEMRKRLEESTQSNISYNAQSRMSMKNSLTLSREEVEKRINTGEPYVIRLKVNPDESIQFNDIIREGVVFESNQIDDKVIFKSDGMPTYHLANVVDDFLMKISHVIRGEEWLSSTPIHVLLYRYLGWEERMPLFAHLPLILKPDGKGKLSKRDGDRLGFPVFPLDWVDPLSKEQSNGFRERGFIPQAFNNMLAFLGWNPGTEEEIFTMESLVDAFSLERINKSGARFDYEKAKWFNQQHIKSLRDEELLDIASPFFEEMNLNLSKLNMKQFVSLYKDRLMLINDLKSELNILFIAPSQFDDKTIKKKWKDFSFSLFNDLKKQLNDLVPFESAEIEQLIKTVLEKNKLGFGDVLPLLRMMLTGQKGGPFLFDLMELLGKEEVVNRIEKGLAKFPQIANGDH